jgi:hypothetical protein
LNGTRAMIDLEDYDKNLDKNDENDPNIVICEVIFLKKHDFISTDFVNSCSHLTNHNC